MDHKTLFPVLEMGFLFLISRWNLQFALIADFGKLYLTEDDVSNYYNVTVFGYSWQKWQRQVDK